MKSHLKERVYLASPIWFQNVLVSLYGLLEHGSRYTGIYHTLSNQLFEDEFKGLKEQKLLADTLLQGALSRAIKDVPYYRSLGIENTDIKEFPLLNRAEIFQAPEKFVSDKYEIKNLMTLYTGGSTGAPLKVYLTKDIRRKSYAFWNRFYKGIGFSIGEKKATFVGRKVQEPDDNRPPFWRYNLIDRQVVFSSFHLTLENIPLYIDKLNSFKPKLIEGYPLSILRLAEYILEHKTELSFVPAGISTSSENFSAEQRKKMEDAFGCKVFDQYGSAESVVFASECEYGQKHIAVEYGLVEVLKENGEIVNEGEGELVVTSLLNDVMPLIRYRIGDLGKVVIKECACKRETPILEELYGKVGSVIVVEGKKVSTAAIAIAFEYLEHVTKSQIIQNEENKVIVKLVTTPGFSNEEQDFMLWELKKMLSQKLEICVEIVEDIPPAKNGKYQMVVQNYYK